MSDLQNAPIEEPVEDVAENEETIPQDVDADVEGDLDAEPEPEIEYKGGKYKVAREVKEAYEAMQAETTRKFQEASKIREEAEARHRMNLEIDTQKAQFFKDVAKVDQINEALTQYDKVDWARWELDDPAAAGAADRERGRLERARDKMILDLRGKAQAYSEYQNQESSKRRTEAETQIKAKIKDWSPQRAETVQKTMEKEYGLDANTFNNIVLQNAVAAEIVHDAFLYRQSKRKAAAPQLKTVQTVQTVKSSSPTTKDPDKMSITEWNAWMDKQEAAKYKTRQKH